MEDVGLFYVYLVYFMPIRYILSPIVLFSGYLVYFSRFGIL
jgi:hypothetical protein